ncbi:MAG: glycosyltransferase family 2 protein [Acidobacteriota bacterium]
MSWEVSEFWRGWIEVGAWVIAGAWCVRTAAAIEHMPEVEDLSVLEWDVQPQVEASLVVVVPAKDEAESIAATMDALMAADYPRMKVVAVDDRSTDATGEILEEYAQRYPGHVEVIHIEELPEGWLGKTFAMTVALANSTSDYVLFTDADVLHSPSILRRALAYVELEEADHLVVMPTPLVKSRGEGIVLGFLQMLSMWASRPWRVKHGKSRRDAIGVGAFNLVRRAALEEIGGLEPQRLAVLEDITLGLRVRAAGMRQRVAFAPGLVLVHWAKGMRGVVKVMTKNLFSAFNFNPLLLMGACAWIVVFCLLPIAGLAWWGTLVPSLLILCAMGAAYRTVVMWSGIDARYAWLYPVGAVAFLYALLRSMVAVWVRGGVVWRGTHYALRDLRRHNSPFQWELVVAEAKKGKGWRE